MEFSMFVSRGEFNVIFNCFMIYFMIGGLVGIRLTREPLEFVTLSKPKNNTEWVLYIIFLPALSFYTSIAMGIMCYLFPLECLIKKIKEKIIEYKGATLRDVQK